VRYHPREHSARATRSYVFQQLIPYIGNKRKLLGLIGEALGRTGLAPQHSTFVDLFAGSGVVSRYAKQLGFRVVANDWEPYALALNRCFVGFDRAPRFGGESYEATIAALNALPPSDGWVATHLCPPDDERFDPATDRLFFMRKNGRRIDAIRQCIARWEEEGRIDEPRAAALIAPLLYAACYASNTSGVFKGFHQGWGGRTGTALYRIKGDLELIPALFLDNGREHEVTRLDALDLAGSLPACARTVAYLDPPYNQHPYGSNYHVLNTITLWDSPEISPTITGRGDKSAIRTDWRTERRSAYNSRATAAEAFRALLAALPVRWIATSYSTDGAIGLRELVAACAERGATSVAVVPYKRYRVSGTRPSPRPFTLEFVLLTDTASRGRGGPEEIVGAIEAAAAGALRH
jgi:adenine-specific DNA-methyltransferase